MTDRQIKRETERVVRKVLRYVKSQSTIGRQEFGVIVSKIADHVHKNTGVSKSVISRKTEKVLADLPYEYGQLSEDMRSWETMISYLYMKYLRELKVL